MWSERYKMPLDHPVGSPFVCPSAMAMKLHKIYLIDQAPTFHTRVYLTWSHAQRQLHHPHVVLDLRPWILYTFASRFLKCARLPLALAVGRKGLRGDSEVRRDSSLTYKDSKSCSVCSLPGKDEAHVPCRACQEHPMSLSEKQSISRVLGSMRDVLKGGM